LLLYESVGFVSVAIGSANMLSSCSSSGLNSCLLSKRSSRRYDSVGHFRWRLREGSQSRRSSKCWKFSSGGLHALILRSFVKWPWTLLSGCTELKCPVSPCTRNWFRPNLTWNRPRSSSVGQEHSFLLHGSLHSEAF